MMEEGASGKVEETPPPLPSSIFTRKKALFFSPSSKDGQKKDFLPESSYLSTSLFLPEGIFFFP